MALYMVWIHSAGKLAQSAVLWKEAKNKKETTSSSRGEKESYETFSLILSMHPSVWNQNKFQPILSAGISTRLKGWIDTCSVLAERRLVVSLLTRLTLIFEVFSINLSNRIYNVLLLGCSQQLIATIWKPGSIPNWCAVDWQVAQRCFTCRFLP
jgi:hypothetical protein